MTSTLGSVAGNIPAAGPVLEGALNTVGGAAGGVSGTSTGGLPGGLLKARDAGSLPAKPAVAFAHNIRADLETRVKEAVVAKARDGISNLADPISRGPELSSEQLDSLESLTELSQEQIESMPEAALARLEAQAANRGD